MRRFVKIAAMMAVAVLAIMALTAPLASASTGAVYGNVVDESGSPIEGALVQVSDGSEMMTDDSGAYYFSLEQGEYRVQVSKDGYDTMDYEADLRYDDDDYRRIELRTGGDAPFDGTDDLWEVWVIVMGAIILAAIAMMVRR